MRQISDFVFNDHILRLEPSLPWWRRLRSQKSIDALLEQSRKRYTEEFRLVEWFFNQMLNQQYCRTRYVVDHAGTDYETHNVQMSESGIETFTISGKFPEFRKNDKLYTVLHVSKNSDDFALKFEGHPQVELIPYSPIRLEYQFEAILSLGDKNGYGKPKFTKNPHKIWGSSEKGFCTQRYFYGEPGKVYFRPFDALHEECLDTITGVFCAAPRDRKNLHLQGRLYVGERLAYQGIFVSTGTFPFFLRRDLEGQRTQESPQQDLVLT